MEGSNAPVERESASPLQHSISATSQLEYQILLAHDLGYIDEATFDELTVELYEVRRMMMTRTWCACGRYGNTGGVKSGGVPLSDSKRHEVVDVVEALFQRSGASISRPSVVVSDTP